MGELQQHSRHAPPSREAIETVLMVASPKLRLTIQLAISLALHVTELTALRYRHIDWENSTLSIMRDDMRPPDASLRADFRASRQLLIDGDLVDAIREHRERSVYKKDHDFLVPNEHGRRLHPSLVSRSLAAVFDQLGWPYDLVDPNPATRRFSYYSLRRYAIDVQLHSGMSEGAIRGRLGLAVRTP